MAIQVLSRHITVGNAQIDICTDHAGQIWLTVQRGPGYVDTLLLDVDVKALIEGLNDALAHLSAILARKV